MGRILKRMLISLVALIFVLVIAGSIYIVTTTDPLPTKTNETIDQVMSSPIPELVSGKSGFVNNQGVNIWYECINPPDSIKGTVLMFMGIGSDALAWPEHFFQPIVKHGYQVIRLDNRGTGKSDWIKDWKGKGAYTLNDMAADGVLILDTFGINQFHVLGVSLGGMIAQQTAINYPHRVLSLTSIMSSGYVEDPELPGISMDIMKKFIKLALRYGVVPTERNTIKLNIAARTLLMGDQHYDIDIQGIAEEVLYNLRKRNGYNAQATQHQSAATTASGSRYVALSNLTCPALVIHGTSDPLMPFVHGQKTAESIPVVNTLWVEGMGHDVPEIFVDTVLTWIFDFWDGR